MKNPKHLFNSRDTAVRALKGHGVAKVDYNRYIEKTGDEKYSIAAYFAGGKKRVSCASTARDLIRAGKTNAEVWEVIQKEFKLDDSKKHYPSWYRSAMKREAKS